MQDAFRALKELSSLAHRMKSNPLLSVRLAHAAYPYSKSSSPFVQHALAYVLHGADLVQPKKLCDHVVSRAQQFQRVMNSAHEQAAHTASLKIHKGAVVVAHASPLVDVFVDNKNVTVHAPASGRVKGAKIHDDHAIHLPMKHADFVLVGTAAITPQGIIAPMGAGLLAELAQAQGIPTYVAATGLHFQKNAKPNANQELLAPAKVNGIISELGVFQHKDFIKEVENHYPFTLLSWP